jgi:succinoglycan biosynthesis protein ExoA
MNNSQSLYDPQCLVSIIVPIRNEADYIERCLDAIVAQDHPTLECWVIDGMSTDATRDLLTPYLQKYAWIRCLDNPEQTAPYAMNYGLAEVTGEVIIRVDGHCEIASDYVSNCLRLLDETGADCVGGPLVSQGDTRRAQAIALAMSSPFGVGNARFRYSQTPGWVDTLAFGAYRKAVFDTVGHFNSELTRNQDDEFNYRLRSAGCKIYLSPDIQAVYYTRGSFHKLWKQYQGYGLWKIRVMQQYPGSTQWRHLVPAGFVAGLSLGLLGAGTRRGRQGLALILGPYSLLALVMGIRRCRSATTVARPWIYLPEMLMSFPLLHLAYGVGFWRGIITALSTLAGRVNSKKSP